MNSEKKEAEEKGREQADGKRLSAEGWGRQDANAEDQRQRSHEGDCAESSGAGEAKVRRRDAGEQRLGARNRQLVATLAVTRYLSTQQVGRLFYPERYGTSCLRRLAQLSGRARLGNFEPALLRKLQFRVYGGGMVDIWGLTDSGYAIAEDTLGAELTIPRKDVGAEYRQHCIVLNDVFVGLALPYLRAGWRVSRLPFLWSPSESVRLPWTEYDAKENKRYDRLVIPDAVLEIGEAKRRIFVVAPRLTPS